MLGLKPLFFAALGNSEVEVDSLAVGLLPLDSESLWLVFVFFGLGGGRGAKVWHILVVKLGQFWWIPVSPRPTPPHGRLEPREDCGHL